MPDNRQAHIFTFKNEKGLEIQLSNFGGIITKVLMPDNNGKTQDVVLGFDTLEAYLENPPYFGALIGRVAGRISRAEFTLDNKIYPLSKNNNNGHLHGGIAGFSKKHWEIVSSSKNKLTLKYVSPDGEEGYPGNLEVEVSYSLQNNNELHIEYSAQTDQPTPLNLTNHSYFNLRGKGNVLDHRVEIVAGKYLESDKNIFPTGKLLSVKNTVFDFRKAKTIGQDLERTAGGYDHVFVLDKKPGEFTFAARASDPQSGRTLEVYTTQPGLVFYTANFLENCKGKKGEPYQKHAGFCFETQHFPDSPNRPEFPNTILRPGKTYMEHTVYKFL
jgi:aldose 1-epimerase